MFPIEQNVPIPPKWETRTTPKWERIGYRWSDMRPGDSFLVPCEPYEAEKTRQRLLAAANRRYPRGERYTTRCVPDGVRIWRVA